MKRKEKMRIEKQGEDKGKAEGKKVKANEKEEKLHQSSEKSIKAVKRKDEVGGEDEYS